MEPIKLKVVIGSTRPERGVGVLLPWLVDRLDRDARFDVEVLDLREWDLPMFQETWETARNGYSTETVRRWNENVVDGDAFLFVTPEYNHSITAVLKNAIDSVFMSSGFRNKVAGTIAYSGGLVGGARAVEHLAGIAVESELVPLRNSVLVSQYHRAFDEDARPIDPMTDRALTILLDDLAWWGDALRAARRTGELPPAGQRRVA